MANTVHYPSLASFEDVEIAAICDLDTNRLNATADKYQVAGRYSDYRKMIEEVAPDGVYASGTCRAVRRILADARSHSREPAEAWARGGSITMTDLISTEYEGFLDEIKQRLRAAQVRAMAAVNAELIAFYWWLGQRIVEEQERRQWGDQVLQRLARDLKAAFPDMGGFSQRNLYRMRAFYLTYRAEGEIVPQPVAQIPWGHNALLLEKLKDNPTPFWYAAKALENGWSRAVLEHQIETRLHERQGRRLPILTGRFPCRNRTWRNNS